MFNIQILPSLNNQEKEKILEINDCIVINSKRTNPDLLIIWESGDEYDQMIKNKVSSLPVIVITKNKNRERKYYFYEIGVAMYIILSDEEHYLIECRIINEIKKHLHYLRPKLFIDFEKQLFIFNNQKYALSHIELQILNHLYQHINQYVSSKDLKNQVWNTLEYIDSNTINVYIHRLRCNLQTCDNLEIINKRATGYKLVIKDK
ncbi:winged helix-turn-helix domain-containing protein [Staphylococcus sp. HMSC036D05]|uniref:winged helix-turn-helix domain-containing protein n=1 Tax=Staphylococcus sp. HMSC036D05 TaxID=1715059 RepID=UPI0008A87EF0|nr:winged helix-turn-helix domain-containing protein [Staphylococcus sp. HMSC036D05]OHO72010.1 GdmQ [Staphylococcus sp. HMSC036D05]